MSEAGPAWRRKLESVLGAEVSSRSLGLVRIFGALTIWTEFASPWVAHRMDDHTGTWLLAWAVLISVWFVIFGLKTRWAAAILALSFAGLQLYYGVHVGVAKLLYPVQELQIVVLLALTPCGRSLSIDRALEVRKARREGRAPAPERVAWWQLELFIIQTATVYFWAAYEGCDPQWLDGSLLEIYVLTYYGSADTFVLHPNFHGVVKALARTATLLEFAFVFGLLYRRTRPYMMWVALAFVFVHMLAFSHNYAISYVYLMMMVPLIACLPPAWVHELVSHQAPKAATT